MQILERCFKLNERGVNVRTAFTAALTVFLTLACISCVNPSVLGDAGTPKDAVFHATWLIGVLVFLPVELFDANATLLGVAKRAGRRKEGKVDGRNKAALAGAGDICAN